MKGLAGAAGFAQGFSKVRRLVLPFGSRASREYDISLDAGLFALAAVP